MLLGTAAKKVNFYKLLPAWKKNISARLFSKRFIISITNQRKSMNVPPWVHHNCIQLQSYIPPYAYKYHQASRSGLGSCHDEQHQGSSVFQGRTPRVSCSRRPLCLWGLHQSGLGGSNWCKVGLLADCCRPPDIGLMEGGQRGRRSANPEKVV